MGGLVVNLHVWPPSSEVAAWAALFVVKSPPPTIPCQGSRNATEKPPALGLLTSGVSYACQVSPPSRVARIRAMLEPPVVIQAFWNPSVVMQVPLEENEASPDKAGGILRAIECQVLPSKVRMSGKTPLTESLWVMP